MTVVGWLMAVWCVGFAMVNVVMEASDHLAYGEYAEYTAAFTVMNWLVAVLKVLGAAVALLSVSRRPPRIPAMLLGMAVWGVFATLAVYVAGSMVQAVGMSTGLAGSADELDVASVAYLCMFVAAASGWGVLAIAYSRRHDLGWDVPALGVLAAPVLLALLLLVVPTVLAEFGFMSTP